MKKGNLFGRALGDLLRDGYIDPQTNIPYFMVECFDVIVKKGGLDEEGLFRVSGSKDSVLALKQVIDYAETE